MVAELTLLAPDADATDALTPEALAAGFPSPELLGAAAAMFTRVRAPERAAESSFVGPRLADGSPVWLRPSPVPEGRRFFLEVGAGTVALRVYDPGRSERRKVGPSQITGDDPRLIDVDAATIGVPIDARAFEQGDLVDGFTQREGTDASRYLMPDLTVAFGSRPHRPRAPVVEWSRKSRANLRRCLRELDYRKMFSRGLPAMVTLTYPGDWQTAAPTGSHAKAHLEAWTKRFARAWGYRPEFPWKLELQRRGAPHFHLFMVCPMGRTGHDDLLCVDGHREECRDFKAWLSWSWSEVVAHPDPEERRKHRLAGTGVDWKEGLRCRDPQRLAVYFLKHSAPGGLGAKEYQHQLPDEWRAEGAGPGRWWGYVGLTRPRAYAGVSVRDFHAMRRVLRRYSSARVPVNVDRVDTRTGLVRSRIVHRRRRLLATGRMQGGWVSANSGPALAETLSRLPGLGS